MTHYLRLNSDRVIRSYYSLIVLFDFIFHNNKPTETSKAAMAAYFHKAQLFGWFSSQTDATLNNLHTLVGKTQSDFPIIDINHFFKESRRLQVELAEHNLNDSRLRPLLLNVVYFDRWGASPFDVAFKGNEPHVDHIYPQSMLKTKMNCSSQEINDIGNLRFLGATDNIRKRAEKPDSYFSRLKSHGVPIEKHLLVGKYSNNPALLKFEKLDFDKFRMERRDEIWKSLKRIVDLETI